MVTRNNQKGILALKEKYYRYKHDAMRQRDETKDYYFRKSLVGSIFVCDMILEDLQEFFK